MVSWVTSLIRRLGLFASLSGFRWAWLPQDAVAGLMLVAIAIPGQIATAHLANMPPQTGLYAFLAGTLAFAAFGANRYISVAADSTIAPIFASVLAVLAGSDLARYGELVTALALFVGIILAVIGMLRAGWVADLLSIPVTTGFLGGVAVHIVVGQLPALLGIDIADGHLVMRFVEILCKLPQANPHSAAISAFVLLAVLLAGRFSRKIPGSLIGLSLTSFAVWYFELQHEGVAVLGALPPDLPRFRLPQIGADDLARMFSLSLTIALICMMQTAAVVRSFPSIPGEVEDISKDFTAVGLGNMLSAFFGAFPVNASPPSTAVVAGSGGKSQLSGLFAAAMIVTLILFSGPLFAYVPMPALCAVLVFIGFRIFRLREMIAIARYGGFEIILVIASICLVVLLPIENGVLLSVILSLIHSIYTVARPVCAELVRLPGTTVWWPPEKPDKTIGEKEPGVVVFAPSAPINFTNIAYIRRRLIEKVSKSEPTRTRFVVIDASGVAAIDYTGAQVLSELIVQLRGRGIDVAIARLSSPQAQNDAARSGLLAILGNQFVFHSVEDAVRKFDGGGW